jgi:predicted ATP-grasp superfamily ATP-dependent carboligase
MDNDVAVLIVAISGRALASSARRGGYRPLVTDMFGDLDTLTAAHAHVRLPGDLASGIDQQALMPVLESLTREQNPIGVVCGTGFEDRTQLLQCLANRWRLLGNGAEVVTKAKNPEFLSRLCADFDVRFPEISLSKPSDPHDWLIKRRGGAGGTHIRPLSQSRNHGGQIYYQRRVCGTPVAASFLADGECATILGFSAQWSSPTPRQPYRYGGAVRPARLAPHISDSLSGVVRRIAAAMSLVGLNSVDFLIDGESFWLMEINPRPGATLDIFETADGSLFAQHVAACTGRSAKAPRYPKGASAAEIVYAEDDILSVPALDWPDWTTDRPVEGSTIKAGEPVCTVHARSPAVAGARALAEKRRETILSWTRARSS